MRKGVKLDKKNPFSVQPPESMPAADVVSLFVEEFSDYQHILDSNHSMIFGPRGAGKSMIFRFMEPDCQTKESNRKLNELEFFGVHVPIKDASLNIPELERFEKAKFSPSLINEHLLISHIASRIFKSLAQKLDSDAIQTDEFFKFWTDQLSPRLIRAGLDFEIPESDIGKIESGDISVLVRLFDDLFENTISYIRKSGFTDIPDQYSGPLFGYGDFLKPVLEHLSRLEFMPNGPIFLLIDDADNLNRIQTEILNSWIASRTTGEFCLKVAAETLKYKTFTTLSGRRIEMPHDYQEVQIQDIYTTRYDTYKKRITAIVEKRLKAAGINKTALEFFPDNKKQEAKIDTISKTYRSQKDSEARGFRAGDDALRYARPDYIKGLKGTHKSSQTYSYAGFNQLIHISSGVIRNFLDPASDMFSEMFSNQSNADVDHISHSVQDRIVKERAKKLLINDFSDMKRSSDDPAEIVLKLSNLVNALGGMFHEILVSDASERRVFSIAFSSGPDDEVQEVLDMGVTKGYLHQSSIGNKKGNGRVPLYILTRRLAPAFILDPTSFSGYKYVTNDKVLATINSPKKLLDLVKIKGFESVMDNDTQGNLFE